MTDLERIKKSKKIWNFLNIRWRSELSKLVIIPQYLLSGDTCTPGGYMCPWGYIYPRGYMYPWGYMYPRGYMYPQ